MAAVDRRSGQVVTVQAGRGGTIDEECKPEDGKVENVVKKWLVYEDRVIADKIQNEEIEQHYNKNRQNRRAVREDIPVAKEVYSQEEAKAQYERMQQLEEQRRIAARDEEIARHLQSKLTDGEREELRRKQIHDEEFARQIQEREARRRYEQNQGVGSPPRPGSDYSYAYRRGYPDTEGRHSQHEPHSNDYQQLSEAVGGPTLASFQTGTLDSRNSNDEDFDEETLEAEDRELAERLQREEEERYERKKQQRALAKERKRLERLINQSQRQENGSDGYPPPTTFPPGAEEDTGDFSDFYVPPDPNMPPELSRRLQEEQDAELARLMQDQEKRKPRSDVLRDRLRQIENQDLELARIIQEEENLRAKRRTLKHQQKLLQQQREVAERIASHNSSPNQTMSSVTSNHGAAAPRPAERISGRQENGAASGSLTIASPSGLDRQFAPSSQYNGRRGGAEDYLDRRQQERQPAGDSSPWSDTHERQIHSENINTERGTEIVRQAVAPTTIVRDPEAIYPEGGSVASRVPPSAGPRVTPTASSRQAKIPISLPGRMMHNTNFEMKTSGNGSLAIKTDIPHRDLGQGAQHDQSNERVEPSMARREMYAEKPSAGRGGYSPSRSMREASPPGPALPERRYREDNSPSPTQRHDRAHIQMGLPAQQPRPHSHHQGGQSHGAHGVYPDPNTQPGHQHRSGGPPRGSEIHTGPHIHVGSHTHSGGVGPPRNPGPPMSQERYAGPQIQQDRGQERGRGHEMPPYRGLHPPPYPASYNSRYSESSDVSPSSPRSAETHYDTPWDLSQLESQLLRDASVNQQAQPIKPRQVSPPGRRGEPPNSTRSPPVQGPGGRPLIEQNEDGQIVMNIAEMLDPTYSRRQGQRSSIAEQRHPAQGYEGASSVPPTVAGANDGEITAIAGQRRSGKKQSGKRESCKQQ